MMSNPPSKEARDSVIVIALKEFESGPVWWIGFYDFQAGCEDMTLDDADSHEEFGDSFGSTEPLKTFPPNELNAAMKYAHEAANEHGLSLYRVTHCRTPRGATLNVFESL